jgi:hypothetical protein
MALGLLTYCQATITCTTCPHERRPSQRDQSTTTADKLQLVEALRDDFATNEVCLKIMNGTKIIGSNTRDEGKNACDFFSKFHLSLQKDAHCFLCLVAVFLAVFCSVSAQEPFHARPVPGESFNLMPESERPLQRLIIGLEANSTKAYMIPGSDAATPTNKERIRLLRRELYMLRIQLVHGDLMKVMPKHTRLFVAVPDPEYVAESRGNEPELFSTYLKTKAGWTDKQIKNQVSFFEVPEALVFPQDMAEVLGRDTKGRLVLGVGEDSAPVYRHSAKLLADTFPADFQLHTIPDINTEGGDIELVWRPDGSIGLMIGQNRVRRYLETSKGMDLKGRVIPTEWIASASAGFQKGFFGVPVMILGWQELQEPKYISTEVFHIDMVVNILRSGTRVMGFIPSYEKNPVDAFTDLPMGADIVERAQRYYDQVAQDLKENGYEVVRLPFSDHPIRNPVNVGRFTDPTTGRATILLAKYPYHYPTKAGQPSIQAELQQVLDSMEDALELWQATPSDENWEHLENSLKAIWDEFKKIEGSVNPIFEAQAKIYRSKGIDVIPVVIYPSSEGGLHCMLLK